MLRFAIKRASARVDDSRGLSERQSMIRRTRDGKALRAVRERKYRLRGGKPRTTRFIPDADSDFAHMARFFAEHVMRRRRRGA